MLSSQQRVKLLEAARQSKYKFLHKTQEARTAEMQRQKEKMSTLLSVVQRLEEDYPDDSAHLKQLTASIRNHATLESSKSSKEVVCT